MWTGSGRNVDGRRRNSPAQVSQNPSISRQSPLRTRTPDPFLTMTPRGLSRSADPDLCGKHWLWRFGCRRCEAFRAGCGFQMVSRRRPPCDLLRLSRRRQSAVRPRRRVRALPMTKIAAESTSRWSPLGRRARGSSPTRCLAPAETRATESRSVSQAPRSFRDPRRTVGMRARSCPRRQEGDLQFLAIPPQSAASSLDQAWARSDLAGRSVVP